MGVMKKSSSSSFDNYKKKMSFSSFEAPKKEMSFSRMGESKKEPSFSRLGGPQVPAYKSEDKNPNPRNWKLIRKHELDKYLILELEYPNCTNFEGRKILVFKGVSYVKLIEKNVKMIDPHFSDNKEFFSPVARFEPTEFGWNAAMLLCQTLISLR